MSKVIMKVRVMPESLEVNLEKLKNRVNKALKNVAEGEVGVKKQPIAFGLNALDLTLIIPEDKGSTVEDKLSSVEGVQTVNVQSVSLV